MALSDLRDKYLPLANSIADQYGIPSQIFSAVIEKESGWNPTAIGTKGEKGLGQLMPSNVKYYNVNPFDPKENLRAAAAILSDNFIKAGNWTEALARYNAGNNFKAGLGYANDIMSKVEGSTDTYLKSIANTGKDGEVVEGGDDGQEQSWFKKFLTKPAIWLAAILLIMLGVWRIINAK